MPHKARILKLEILGGRTRGAGALNPSEQHDDHTPRTCSGALAVDRVISMPKTNPNAGGREPQLPDVGHFLTTILEIQQNGRPKSQLLVPAELVARLAGLAKVTANHKLFNLGIEWAVVDAHESLWLSTPVYRGKFIKELEQLNRAAFQLGSQIEKVQRRPDRTALLVQESMSYFLKAFKKSDNDGVETIFAPLQQELLNLATAAVAAKHFAVRWVPRRSGRPIGMGKSGVIMPRLIAHLEFAARAGGGSWTLNKNDERGTLIDVLDELKPYLPQSLRPKNGRHPYSSYQKVLSQARAAWAEQPFPHGYWAAGIKRDHK